MFYHVFNRGVDKRTTFEKDADFLQFISQIQYFRFKKGDPTTEIVAVHCYTLMNNHFHLLLEELEDGGVSKFMQRLEIGYTMYFNKTEEEPVRCFLVSLKGRLCSRKGIWPIWQFIFIPIHST